MIVWHMYLILEKGLTQVEIFKFEKWQKHSILLVELTLLFNLLLEYQTVK